MHQHILLLVGLFLNYLFCVTKPFKKCSARLVLKIVKQTKNIRRNVTAAEMMRGGVHCRVDALGDNDNDCTAHSYGSYCLCYSVTVAMQREVVICQSASQQNSGLTTTCQ